MTFANWLLENEIIGSIKPVQPAISWPDAEKASAAIFYDEPWFFYVATYEFNGRQFTFKLTRHASDKTTIHVDGLSSNGDNKVDLQQIIPKLKEDANKMGIINVQFTAAVSNFGRKSAVKKQRTPEQEAAIRTRLFNRTISKFQ